MTLFRLWLDLVSHKVLFLPPSQTLLHCGKGKIPTWSFRQSNTKVINGDNTNSWNAERRRSKKKKRARKLFVIVMLTPWPLSELNTRGQLRGAWWIAQIFFFSPAARADAERRKGNFFSLLFLLHSLLFLTTSNLLQLCGGDGWLV